ncbi:MAG: diphosphomevalonate decarboxylase, partial [Pseudomonadota bacterium]
MSAQEFFNYYLPDKLAAPVEARAFAPSNVALSKYWGKRDKELNLPTNSSLSVSLGDWGTTTSISAASGPNDRIIFDDIELAIDDPAFRRLQVFLDRFRRRQNIPLTIVTKNSVPTSAGLAS